MSQALTTTGNNQGTLALLRLSNEQKALIKQQIAPDLTDAELHLFVEICEHSGLDPFRKEIYAIKRKIKGEPKMTIQIGIDGLRSLAARRAGSTYAGQIGPFWCGDDGEWRDVWLKKESPAAAKVGVLSREFREPVWGIAKYDSFVQTFDGKPQGLWATMPDVMLAKCAEAQALRKAFPRQTTLDGIAPNVQVVNMETGEIIEGDYRVMDAPELDQPTSGNAEPAAHEAEGEGGRAEVAATHDADDTSGASTARSNLPSTQPSPASPSEATQEQRTAIEKLADRLPQQSAAKLSKEVMAAVLAVRAGEKLAFNDAAAAIPALNELLDAGKA